MAEKQPDEILGSHPEADAFGCHTQAKDTNTNSDVPHRALSQDDGSRNDTVGQLRKALIRHHTSVEMRARDQRKREDLRQLGYPVSDAGTHRFPHADKTRKGNLAEVFLAEYIGAGADADLPIYRLRYNPNVEQSMKGDDVLAFDFHSKRVRILVGEAKFRGTSSKAAVQEIVAGLVRSHQAGLPASLQFVADRLFEMKNIDLGRRVENCALLMAQGKLDLQYVGLLLSNTNSKANVDRHTNSELRNLVMISLGIDDPSSLVRDCFDGIEEDACGDSD
ncbi:MAG: Hachiman antiphage defense system protein HamA [Candidatus Krumholzibacteriota bacterium]|nr:Hachiman antiphage defense system protein HamA [Candidatus Krumholzibacteriota bacterium]